MVERVDRRWPVRRKPLIARNRRSVATQVFALELVVVVLLVAGAILAQVLESRRRQRRRGQNRSIAVAQTFAHSPGCSPRCKTPNPSAILQPSTEAARKAAGVDFIVVMNTRGSATPIPCRTGSASGSSAPSSPRWTGRSTPRACTGRSASEVQADRAGADRPTGQVVALVSAGLKVKHVTGRSSGSFRDPGSRRRRTRAGHRRARRWSAGGCGGRPTAWPRAEMTRMYEHHDAVLHAVREGVLIVGERRAAAAGQRRGAATCWTCPPDAEGRHRGPTSRASNPETRRAAGVGPDGHRRGAPGRGRGCWWSTSGPPICTARAQGHRGDPARLHGTARRCRAGPRWPASGWTCCTTPALGIGTTPRRRPHRRGAGPGRRARASRTSSPSIWPTPCCTARSPPPARDSAAPHRCPRRSARTTRSTRWAS